MTTAIHQQMALDYLNAVLREDAPRTLTPVAVFDEAPLHGEGKATVFAFNACIGGTPEEPYYVIAGQTVANYYPQWGLDADQIYSLHLGTRFMLVVQVKQIPLDSLPITLQQIVRDELAGTAPGEEMTDFQPVAAFQADDQQHVVCRARVGGEDVYLLTGSLPLGIYRETHLPPNVVYRWHLGSIIRMERPHPDEEQLSADSTEAAPGPV